MVNVWLKTCVIAPENFIFCNFGKILNFVFQFKIPRMSKITWSTESIALPDLDWATVERWIKNVAKSEGFRLGRLNYIFCDDERILEVNREFLRHDYFTDIITFDYSTPSYIEGDMYISLDTVLSNSELQHVAFIDELLRVIIHGVLHLCGINDKGPGEREIMEAHEDNALELLKEL